MRKRLGWTRPRGMAIMLMIRPRCMLLKDFKLKHLISFVVFQLYFSGYFNCLLDLVFLLSSRLTTKYLSNG